METAGPPSGSPGSSSDGLDSTPNRCRRVSLSPGLLFPSRWSPRPPPRSYDEDASSRRSGTNRMHAFELIKDPSQVEAFSFCVVYGDEPYLRREVLNALTRGLL